MSVFEQLWNHGSNLLTTISGCRIARWVHFKRPKGYGKGEYDCQRYATPTTAQHFKIDAPHQQSRPLQDNDTIYITYEQLDKFDVMQISDESDTGYILDEDLEYPQHLHDSHSDYPLAAEKRQVDDTELSPYSLELKAKLGIKGLATEKLVPNLYKKSRYVLHYQNLKLYLSLGMKLIKIHRAIEFHQSPWLKPYIALNTEKRKNAKNEFEKSFYKLLNNAVYGKFLQNNRKHIDVELVHT